MLTVPCDLMKETKASRVPAKGIGRSPWRVARVVLSQAASARTAGHMVHLGHLNGSGGLKYPSYPMDALCNQSTMV